MAGKLLTTLGTLSNAMNATRRQTYVQPRAAMRAVVSPNESADNEPMAPGFAGRSGQQRLPGNYTEAHSPLMKFTSFTPAIKKLGLNRNANVGFFLPQSFSHMQFV